MKTTVLAGMFRPSAKVSVANSAWQRVRCFWNTCNINTTSCKWNTQFLLLLKFLMLPGLKLQPLVEWVWSVVVSTISWQCTAAVAQFSANHVTWGESESWKRWLCLKPFMARFTISCRIGQSHRAALPRCEDRIHFYLRSRTRQGNATYCEQGIRHTESVYVPTFT